MVHKAGFVSIIGKPNAGKSTLMNAFLGEKLSAVTPKAQTTRHRILGMLNEEDLQIVFSDTPGVIKPNYGLQESMMTAVQLSMADADMILFVTDIQERYDEEEVTKLLQNRDTAIVLVINKVDKASQEEVREKMEYWKAKLNPVAIFACSALHDFQVKELLNYIKANLPEHPAYYPKDDSYTDRTERFIVSEIIRSKVLMQYDKEIPYSTEVVVTSFHEEEHIIKIAAEIIVERDSQKGIIIGHQGAAIKKLGTRSRVEIEEFLGNKVFLELFVKVLDDWRNKKNYLKRFGYES
jgi:GTPase